MALRFFQLTVASFCTDCPVGCLALAAGPRHPDLGFISSVSLERNGQELVEDVAARIDRDQTHNQLTACSHYERRDTNELLHERSMLHSQETLLLFTDSLDCLFRRLIGSSLVCVTRTFYRIFGDAQCDPSFDGPAQ